MRLELTQPAIFKPVSLDAFKLHLRIEHDLEDQRLLSLLETARTDIEHQINSILCSSSWLLTVYAFGRIRSCALRPHPVRAVTQIKVIDRTCYEQILKSDEIGLEWSHDRASVRFSDQVTMSKRDRLEISLEAGLFSNEEQVPEALKTAIILLAASLYNCAHIPTSEKGAQSLPSTVQTLINPYKRLKLS